MGRWPPSNQLQTWKTSFAHPGRDPNWRLMAWTRLEDDVPLQPPMVFSFPCGILPGRNVLDQPLGSLGQRVAASHAGLDEGTGAELLCVWPWSWACFCNLHPNRGTRDHNYNHKREHHARSRDLGICPCVSLPWETWTLSSHRS